MAFASSRSIRLAALTAVLAGVAAPAHADRIGTAGAVNTRSVSAPPGGSERVIEIGAQIVRNERIETSASGSVQVMFIDKTSLTIGPNSKLVIDQFVFNPADNTGSMSLRLGKGLLRVVGGQVTHTGGATVTTPSATIGVRGGIASVQVCGAGCSEPGTRAILHFGSIAVTPTGPGGSSGPTQMVTRPGFGTFVGASPAGQPTQASQPARAAASEISSVNASLTSKSGQQGGSTNVPNDQGAVNNGVGIGTPADPAGVTSRQAQTTSSRTTTTTGANAGAQQPVQQAVSQGQQAATAQVTSTRIIATPTIALQQPSPTLPPVVPRTDPTLVGFSGGILTGRNGTAAASYIVSGRTYVVGPSPTGASGAKIEATVLVGETKRDAVLNFGSAPILDATRTAAVANPNADPGRSLWINSKVFGAVSERTVDPTSGATRETSGFTSGSPSLTSFGSIRSLFVSSDSVGANSRQFLSALSTAQGGVRPCDCEFTRWGFWSVDASGGDSISGNAFTARGSLNTWVAGVPTKPTDLPVTGSATYVGHTTATISNGGATYLAAGTFSNTVNFGTNTGSVAINGLDRTNYAGIVALNPASATFGGTLAGSVGGRNMTLNGAFNQGGPTNISPKYGEMSGQVGITGAGSYVGSGIFAGKRVP